MRKKSAPGLIPLVARRGRAGLLRTTALQTAAVIVLTSPILAPALAQPAPTARPTGGVVVGGSATIGQTTAQTTVQQSSQRAAIDWRSFDVGSQHTVLYNQPNASAIVLNRVTGPDPSQIAGRIQANGQVVITNQSGVVFHQGAQVDTAGLIVSAAGITPTNFMAGRMNFDQAPKPDAAVTNAGTITIKEAGLAALVAPRVANSGVINARMGRVVLAGAETHTVDLYGDGLMAIDVTGQVRQAPRGPDGKPVTALVTNTGTIQADGGSIQITAKAADGIVQNLVQAGGTIRANAADGRTGTVTIAGVGGGLTIEGRVAADGGGTVNATGTGTITVAQSARITANGRSGASANGGTINIGDRTNTAGVTLEDGARVTANGRATGNGGTVNVLSAGRTRMAGRIEARGGAQGGNGGTVEVSGRGIDLSGPIDTSAPAGTPGSVLLDPVSVAISDHGNGGHTDVDSVLTPTSLQAMSGSVTIQADQNIYVLSNLDRVNGQLQNTTLTAGNSVLVDNNVRIQVNAFFTINAGAGGLNVLGSLVARPQGLRLNVSGPVTEGPNGTVSANSISGSVGSLNLPNAGNSIDTLGFTNGFTNSALTATTGSITVSSGTPISLQTGYFTGGAIVPSGQAIVIAADQITLPTGYGTTNLSAPGGTITLQPLTAGKALELSTTAVNTQALRIDPTSLTRLDTATVQLGGATTGAISIAPNGVAIDLATTATGYGTLRLRGTGDITQGASLSLGPRPIGNAGGGTNIALDAAGANITLDNGGNTIPVVTALSGTGNVALEAGNSLVVNGPVTAGGSVNFSTVGSTEGPSPTITLNGSISAGITVRLDTFNGESLSSSGTVQQNSGTITGTTLIGSARAVTLDQQNAISIGTYETSDSFAFTGGPGGISITGALTVGGTTSLTTTGPVTQTAAGTLATGAFEATAGSVVLNNTGNSIGTLLDVTTSTGGFALTTQLGDGVPFLINGDVAVPATQTISLTADRIDFRAASLLATNGSVVLQPLTAGRPIELVSGAQSNAALSITQADLAFINTGTLTLGSPTAGPITIGGANQALTVTGHASTLNLLSGGAVTQGAGATLTVPTLTGNTTSLTLGGANAIGTLGSYTASSGPITLNDSTQLAVTGPVSATGALSLTATGTSGIAFSGNASGSSVILNAGTAGITQTAATITSSAGLTITSAGAVTQSGTGAITAVTLTGSSGGATSLTSAGNAVSVLGGFNATGNFTLQDGSPLTLTSNASFGAVSGANVTLNAPSITLNNGDLNATGTATLTTPGAITGTAALIRAATLTGTAASLSANGVIGTLRDFTTSGDLVFSNGGALNVAGTVGGGTFVSLVGTSLNLTGAISSTVRADLFTTTGDITQSTGSITAPIIQLASGGVLTQTGGLVSTGSLLTSSTGATTLTSPTNQISGITSGTSTGNYTLVTAADLSVFGAINAGANTVSLTAPSLADSSTGVITAGLLTGSTTRSADLSRAVSNVSRLGPFTSGGSFALNNGANPLQLVGALNAGANQVNLVARGITQTAAGVITAGTLTGSSSAGYDLTTATNAISGLGPLASTGGGFALNNGTTALTVVDQLVVPGNTVRLVAGNLAEGASGGITAATLTGSSTGSTNLNSGGNSVGALGPFTNTNGNFSFRDNSALAIQGALNAGTNTVSLSAPSLTQTVAGVITAGTLAGNVTGPTTLTTAANAISGIAGFTAGGAFALNDTVGLTFTGALNAAGNTVSLTAPSIGETAAGAITAGTLSGTVAGTTNLGLGSNAVSALGAFTSTGGFTLNDGTTALAITGALNAGTGAVNLTAASLTETGPGTITAASLSGATTGAASFANANTIGALAGFTAGGAFTLNDGTNALAITGALNAGANTVTLTAASLSQTAAGVVTAGTLTGSTTGATNLGTAANAIGALATFSSGGAFTLNDGTTALAITGALNAGANTVTLTAGSLTEGAAGAITAGTLSGTASGAVSLTGANQIAALGNFTRGLGTAPTLAGFTLADSRNLTVSGTVVNNNGSVSLIQAPGTTVTITGSISAPGQTIGLQADGFSIPGSISTGVGTGTVAIAPATPGQVVTIPLLSNVTTGSLAVGSIDGGATITAGSISIPQAVSLGAGNLSLYATGAIGGTGAITAGTLSGVAGGAVSLTGGNQITTLGSFSSVGGFSLTDARALTQRGTLTDTASITLAAAGALTLGGTLNAPAVVLGSTGALTQTGGAITASTLAVTDNTAALTQAGNSIATLAGVNSTGDFALTNARALSVTGPITSGTSVRLDVAGALALSGTVNAPALALNATGNITQSGGGLTATTLTGSGGAVSLTATNAITTLGAFTITGPFTLNDGTTPLTLAATLNAGTNAVSLTAGSITESTGSITAATLTGATVGAASFANANAIGSLASFTSGGAFTLNDGTTPLTITGPLNAGANTVSLTAGSLSQAATGVITAGTLTGATTGATTLGGPNQIATLGGFTSVGGFSLTDARALTQTGALTDSTSVTLAAAGALTLGGTIGAPTVALASTAALTQTGGGITAGTLAVTADSATLTSTGNAVTNLAGVTTAGAFSLTDSRGLTLTGPVVSNTSLQLDVTGDLTLASAVNAPLVTLDATGNVTQPGGAVTATTLSGTAGGSFLLGSSGNQVDNLGPVLANTAIGVTDARSLTITGAIDPPDVTLNVSGNLAIANTITAGTLTLNVTGAITQTAAGIVTAGTLRGTSGSIVLGTALYVGTLADVTTTGALTVADAIALAITGPVNAGGGLIASSTGSMTITGNITAPTIALNATSALRPASPGNIALSGATLAATGGTTLAAAGAITQSGGSIATPILSGSAGAGVALNAAGNQIASLGAFTAGQGFSLATSGPLAISGQLQAPTTNLVATGAITEGTAGSIATTTLTGSAASALFGNAANAVTNLGTFATTGDFLLNTPSNLNVTGAASVGTGRTLTLTPGTLTLQSGGSLSAPGGTVSLAPFAAGTAFTLSNVLPPSTTNAITASTLQVGNAASGDITVANAFNLPSVNGLALVSGSTISQTPGATITVGRLTANGGTVRLDQANAINTLGNSAAAGAFTLNTTGTTTVAGTVSAGSGLTLSAGSLQLGTTTLPAVLKTPGQVTLNAATAITEPNGSILAGSLTGTAATATLTGTNQTPVLAGFSAGTLAFNNTGPLAVTAPINSSGSVSLNTTGALTLQSSLFAPAVNLTASSIGQSAGANTIGTLNLVSGGDATVLGSVAALGTVQLPGTLRIVNPTTRSLQVAGTVNAGTLDLTGGDIGFTGAVNAGTLRLNAANVTQAGGSLALGTLTGAASGVLVLGNNGTAAIGVITNTSAGPLLQVLATGQVTLNGTNQAGTFTVRGSGITLAGGSILGDAVTIEAIRAATPPITTAQAAITQGATTTTTTNGTATTLAGITQTGTTTITPRTLTTGSLLLQVHGGAITLNDLAAPGSALVLGLDGGTASGTLNVASLFVNGQGGSATLLGTVGGRTGFDAAQVSGITRFDTAYTLNGCAVASASCVTLPPPPAPPQPPAPEEPIVRLVVPGTVRPDIILVEGVLRPDIFTIDLITLDIVRSPTDPDFALPNISDRDY